MKSMLLCGFLVLLSVSINTVQSEKEDLTNSTTTESPEIKESKETKEFIEDFKKVVHALSEGRHADKEKAITDFVKKYGKKRICKYVSPQFEKKDITDEEKALKKSCEDDEQTDEDFIKVAKDNFVGSHHISS